MKYPLCNQTVTVYRQTRPGDYTRTVHNRAFLDYRKTEAVTKTGSKEATGFLLVIPGDTQAVYAGDKVILGVGPEIATREAWADFIPAKAPGLVVVSYADPKYYRGKLVHTEAGG